MKNRTCKKLLAVLLSASMTAAMLAGCGQSSAPAEEEETAEETEVPEEAEETEAPAEETMDAAVRQVTDAEGNAGSDS